MRAKATKTTVKKPKQLEKQLEKQLKKQLKNNFINHKPEATKNQQQLPKITTKTNHNCQHHR